MAKIVFMGTPDFAVPSLRALIEQHQVIGVVTQPDRPAGRSRQIQPSPVKTVALAAGIPVQQPEKIRRPEAVEALRAWSADAYVVAAFGQILPQSVLDIPPFGSINVHASLLPRWRGAAPIQAAIRAGDAQTGITIMKMDAGLDTGPILSQREVAIAPDETGASLHDKLAVVGAELLVETLPGYFAGTVQPQPQNDAAATFAPQIRKEEGEINWTQDAVTIERLVRAFTPWPGTYTTWEGQTLKIIAGSASSGQARPGQVLLTEHGVAIGSGGGLFLPAVIQLAGRKPLPVAEFIKGQPALVGAVLGSPAQQATAPPDRRQTADGGSDQSSS